MPATYDGRLPRRLKWTRQSDTALRAEAPEIGDNGFYLVTLNAQGVVGLTWNVGRNQHDAYGGEIEVPHKPSLDVDVRGFIARAIAQIHFDNRVRERIEAMLEPTESQHNLLPKST